MGRIVQWAKDHPKLAIALGIGIVIVIYLYSRRRSSSASTATTVGTSGLSEQGYLQTNQAELSASTQLQGQQVAAGVAVAQLNDQLQVKQLDDATQLAIAKLQADLQNNTVYAQSTVSSQDITAQEHVALATIQANSQTEQDRLALDTALVNVLAGKNNVLNPSPVTPVSPVVTSSYPNMPISAEPPISYTVPNGGRAPAAITQSPVPYTSIVTLPGVSPTGSAEIPGVDYNFSNQPFAPAYTFPNEEAAVAAGAGYIDQKSGRFIAIPGLQVTY